MICIMLHEGRKRNKNIISLYILVIYFSLPLPLFFHLFALFSSLLSTSFFLNFSLSFLLFCPFLSFWLNMQPKYLYYYYLQNLLNIMFPVLSIKSMHGMLFFSPNQSNLSNNIVSYFLSRWRKLLCENSYTWKRYQRSLGPTSALM